MSEQMKVSVTSIGEVASRLNVQSWRIARLFELGVLDEPPRLSNRRVIPESLVPSIQEALRKRGWLPQVDSQPLDRA